MKQFDLSIAKPLDRKVALTHRLSIDKKKSVNNDIASFESLQSLPRITFSPRETIQAHSSHFIGVPQVFQPRV
jgi:hypothetical protein